MVERLARAVDSAHRLGIVHGDVKPENILCTRNDGELRVKLADFGIATSLAEEARADGDPAIGTPGYMAPEQWRDRRKPDERSDVYCLGGTLYRLLAGKPPHGQRPAADGGPEPLPSSIPARLREVVARALAEDPRQRYASARALADELERFRTHRWTSTDARRPHRWPLLWAARHRKEVVVAAVLIALGAAGAAVLIHLGEAKVRSIEADIASKSAALTDLKRELEQRQSELEDRKRELDDRKTELAGKKAQIDAATESIAHLGRKEAALRNVVLGLQDTIAKLPPHLRQEFDASLAQQFAAQRKELEAQAATQKELEELRVLAARHAGELAALKTAHTDELKTIVPLAVGAALVQLTDLETRNDELVKELAAAKLQLEKLEGNAAEASASAQPAKANPSAPAKTERAPTSDRPQGM
jgi:serine/threonine-protein kinase